MSNKNKVEEQERCGGQRVKHSTCLCWLADGKSQGKQPGPGTGTDKGMAVSWSLQEEKQPANTTIAWGCVSDFWLQK